MSEAAAKPSRTDRTGLKTMVLYLDPDKARRIKSYAFAIGKTVQEVGEDALDLWITHFEATLKSSGGATDPITRDILSKVGSHK